MAFSHADIEANREFFAAKLRAEKSIKDVHDQVTGEGDDEDYVLLDVRHAEDYAEGHIPGALSGPLKSLEQWVTMLPRDRVIVDYCYNYT